MGPELLPMYRGLARRRFGRFSMLLAMFVVLSSSVRSVDLFLPRVGPAPLQFAPAPPKPWDFKWPVPKLGNGSTNETQNLPGGLTNSTSSASLTLQQTNSANSTQLSQNPASVGTPGAFLLPGQDANPSSASNLLLLTPQMLADFFKATLDQTAFRSSTNDWG